MFLVKFTSDDEIIIFRVFAAKNLSISLILRLTTVDFGSHHIADMISVSMGVLLHQPKVQSQAYYHCYCEYRKRSTPTVSTVCDTIV